MHAKEPRPLPCLRYTLLYVLYKIRSVLYIVHKVKIGMHAGDDVGDSLFY